MWTEFFPSMVEDLRRYADLIEAGMTREQVRQHVQSGRLGRAGTVKPRIRGVIAHEAVLPVVERVYVDGLPVTSAARCAIDLARRVRRLDAMPLLDAVLRVKACSRED